MRLISRCEGQVNRAQSSPHPTSTRTCPLLHTPEQQPVWRLAQGNWKVQPRTALNAVWLALIRPNCTVDECWSVQYGLGSARFVRLQNFNTSVHKSHGLDVGTCNRGAHILMTTTSMNAAAWGVARLLSRPTFGCHLGCFPTLLPATGSCHGTIIIIIIIDSDSVGRGRERERESETLYLNSTIHFRPCADTCDPSARGCVGFVSVNYWLLYSW